MNTPNLMCSCCRVWWDTPEQRQRHEAAKSRWRKASAEDRAAHAAKMVEGRRRAFIRRNEL